MKTKIFYFILAFTTFCNAQIINIPDANFKAKLLAANSSNSIAKNLSDNYFKIDSNNDNEIQISEAIQVSFLDISNSNVASLTGITNFTNLNTLQSNHNLLTTLNLVGLINLQKLDCDFNNLSSLNTNGLVNLKDLFINANQFTSFDASSLTNLQYLYINANQLTSLNVNGLVNLKHLSCYNNFLTTLNLNGLTILNYLNCNGNQLQSLDVTSLYNLQTINCASNLLISLFIKNGVEESGLDFSGNTNLQYVCADEVQLSQIADLVTFYGLTNCHTNSYCSFTSGGTFYTIQGNHKYDFNNDGCDISDIIIPNLKINISDGSLSGDIISNLIGNYSIPVQMGTHTVTPILENPTYFNVAPNSFNVSFPTATSPYNQDFCITANGNHNDLEVVILPINQARPGFDTNYKLKYKNKGTTTQTGSINLTFDDSVLDFVSSNPNVSSQSTGSLNWNFANLLPFESREINIVLNLNSPTETPALNNGDILNFSATVNGQTDETPNDNIATLNQFVVNSYDPNDKTCLEGTTITPTMVGEYVHYLIRFENNGTANAQNIVIKDMIDTNKFDINTLIPIKGSHNFETRISSTNKVEFIFQNINLPFDDVNNDGYVSFKIKTKPNLIVGNTFSNLANIYFDYNFPIVTNNYTTTIQNTLGLQENGFIINISVYPNPVKNILNFKTEHNISKVEVYDIAGRILSSNSVSENKIDLSELKTGNYILKLYTEKGIMNTKIIKE